MSAQIKDNKNLTDKDITSIERSIGWNTANKELDLIEETINTLWKEQDLLLLAGFLDHAVELSQVGNTNYLRNWKLRRPSADKLAVYQELLQAGLIDTLSIDEHDTKTDTSYSGLIIDDLVNVEHIDLESSVVAIEMANRSNEREFKAYANKHPYDLRLLSDKQFEMLSSNDHNFNNEPSTSLIEAKQKWNQMLISPERFSLSITKQNYPWRSDNGQIAINIAKMPRDEILRIAQTVTPEVVKDWHNEHNGQGFNCHLYSRPKTASGAVKNAEEKVPMLAYSRFVKNKYDNEQILTLVAKVPDITIDKWDKLTQAEQVKYVSIHFGIKQTSKILTTNSYIDQQIKGIENRASITPVSKSDYKIVEKIPVAKALGSRACEHKNSEWVLNPSHDALYLNCKDCFGTKIHVIPRHQITNHPHAVKPAERPQYLVRENIYRRAKGLPVVSSFKELQTLDGITTLDAKQYATAEWDAAMNKQPRQVINPLRKKR